MSDRAQRLSRTDVVRALSSVLDCLRRSRTVVDYRLVGTGAALLHGVDLPVGDIDILVRERGAVDAIGSALAGFECPDRPAWLPDARQYYANYRVGGVEVGISTVEVEYEGDTVETLGSGPWVHYADLPCGPHTVPAVALELRLHTELHRNRPDRYEPILAYMAQHGCDRELLERCIAPPCDLPVVLKDRVAQMLGHAAG